MNFCLYLLLQLQELVLVMGSRISKPLVNDIASSSSLYAPLTSANSIRILSIQSGNPEDFISCNLREVDLKEWPKYCALSYVWGDAGDTVLVLCNGQEIKVTVNLAHALRRLRNIKDPTDFWIDAISINQCDRQERGQQVSLMRHIFSQVRLLRSMNKSLISKL
jgi:hypothetical protein